MKKSKSGDWKKQMVQHLELPKDLLLGAVLIHVTGQSEMEVENYRGILFYSRERVRLSVKDGQLEVTGQDLNIEYYSNDNMKITGCIRQISYLM